MCRDRRGWRGYRGLGRLRAGSFQCVVQHPQKSTSVKVDRVYLDRLSTGQGRQSLWQFLGRGHLGVVDENWNDSNVVSSQRGFDLETDEVLGIIETSHTPGIGDREPLRADQCEQHLAGAHCRLNAFDEVVAGLNVVDILEDPASAQLGHQQVVELSRRPRRVLASIADEDSPGLAFLHTDHFHSPTPAVSLRAKSLMSIGGNRVTAYLVERNDQRTPGSANRGQQETLLSRINHPWQGKDFSDPRKVEMRLEIGKSPWR